MVDILGADAGTFTRVVAALFLGLSAGAYFAAKRPTSRPWRSVAIAEIATALLALALIIAAPLLDRLPQSAAVARQLRWLLPLLLVAPPAFAMGTVVPWMIRATDGAATIAIYGVNTLGGIAGLAFALLWALPAFGLTGACAAALALNLLVAIGAALLSRRGESARDFEPASILVTKPGGAKHAPRLLMLAFGSGFLVLGAEVLHQHQLAQLLISSHFSSALVLVLVLAALGIGALLAIPLAGMGKRHSVTIALACAALACAAQPLALVVQRGGLHYIPFQQPLGSYAWDAFRMGIPGCALLLLPAALVFPLLLRRAAEQRVDAGLLLAVNGLGGWFGAECAERLLAPVFGLWWSMALIAGGYAACVFLETGRTRWWLTPSLAAVIAWSWKIDARLPFAGLAKGDTLVKVAVGREGVIGVVRGEPDDWRILFNNNYTLGGSRAQFNQERQTLLPMLLHGDARRVATLGVATGGSLAGATLDPAFESAEGIELSPLVLSFAAEYFAPFNRRVLADPRVRITLGDARIIIAQRRVEFDVIAGDLFLPWRTGESRMFSREHFQNVRAALRPGGIFCQWLPVYQLTRAQFDTIARTFREVFPEAWLLRGDFYEAMPIVALVGGRSLDSVDWGKVGAACDRTRGAGLTRDPLLRHAEGVAMCVVGPLPAPPPGPVNTLANSWLEWDAARNVIGLREPWFVHLPLATYLRDIRNAATPSLPAQLRSAHQAGILLHALEIAGAAQLAVLDDLARRVRAGIPAPLRDDLGADWSRFPMQHPSGIFPMPKP